MCFFFFFRQECLGMPELQRAAEFFFFQLEAFWNEKKKGQHVDLLKSCSHAFVYIAILLIVFTVRFIARFQTSTTSVLRQPTISESHNLLCVQKTTRIRPPVAYKFYVRNDRGWSRGTGYGTVRNAAGTLDKSPVRSRQVWGSIPHETLPFEWHEARLTMVFFIYLLQTTFLKLRTSTCVLSRNALVAMVYIGLLFSCSP